MARCSRADTGLAPTQAAAREVQHGQQQQHGRRHLSGRRPIVIQGPMPIEAEFFAAQLDGCTVEPASGETSVVLLTLSLHPF